MLDDGEGKAPLAHQMAQRVHRGGARALVVDDHGDRLVDGVAAQWEREPEHGLGDVEPALLPAELLDAVAVVPAHERDRRRVRAPARRVDADDERPEGVRVRRRPPVHGVLDAVHADDQVVTRRREHSENARLIDRVVFVVRSAVLSHLLQPIERGEPGDDLAPLEHVRRLLARDAHAVPVALAAEGADEPVRLRRGVRQPDELATAGEVAVCGFVELVGIAGGLVDDEHHATWSAQAGEVLGLRRGDTFDAAAVVELDAGGRVAGDVAA